MILACVVAYLAGIVSAIAFIATLCAWAIRSESVSDSDLLERTWAIPVHVGPDDHGRSR